MKLASTQGRPRLRTVKGRYTMADISVFEAMHSLRSIHRFTTNPVSDEAVTTILRAAVRAPSGGNSQPWHFLVIRDKELKRRIGEYQGKATLEARRER